MKHGPNRGRTTGLKKYEYVAKLFARQYLTKLSDIKLCRAIEVEFPKCQTKWIRRIGYLRNLYNRGKLRFQKKKKACFRYDERGMILPRRRGPKSRGDANLDGISKLLLTVSKTRTVFRV